MIRIRIITPGKDKDQWLTGGIEHYLKLLSRYASTEFKILSSPKAGASLSPDEIKKNEAVLFEKEFKDGYYIALSDKGQKKDSEQFARFLEQVQTKSRGPLNFMIGGPYGLDEHILAKADYILSLSEMTFSHQLIRLVLLEQLYRGFSILHGTAYHK